MTEPNEIRIVIDAVKMGAWIGLAVAVFKVGKVLAEMWKGIRVYLAEHRVLIRQHWINHPEGKDDFYLALDQPQPAKAKSAAAGRRQ